VCVCVCVCVRACVRECVRACMRMCIGVRMPFIRYAYNGMEKKGIKNTILTK